MGNGRQTAGRTLHSFDSTSALDPIHLFHLDKELLKEIPKFGWWFLLTELSMFALSDVISIIIELPKINLSHILRLDSLRPDYFLICEKNCNVMKCRAFLTSNLRLNAFQHARVSLRSIIEVLN
jgi:hypothetical protein